MSKLGNGGRKRKHNDHILADDVYAVQAATDIAGEGVDRAEQAENLEMKSEADARKPVRTFRRDWKYKVPDGILNEKAEDDEMCACSYVSGRTRLMCKNIRQASEVDSNGFCEVHARFFRQLKQLYTAEQLRSDPGLFVAKTVDEDGSLVVSDDDETLATSLEWPPSCEDLCGNFIENDECHPLQYSGTLVDEEVLLIKLAMLERKKLAVQRYRELLIEKAKRKAAFYRKKVAEESKKGGLIATTRKEKAVMQNHRAAKTYRHWMRSSVSEYMKKRNSARLNVGDETWGNLSYLGLGNDSEDTRRCVFVKKEEEDSSQVEDPMSISLAPPQCSNRAVPKSSYCLEHITEDRDQKLFAICEDCSGIVQDFGLASLFAFESEFGKGNCFSSKICRCLRRVSNDSLKASSSESSIAEEDQVKSVKIKPSLGTRLLDQSNGDELRSLEKGSIYDSPSKFIDDGENPETPVKYVVIGSSDEDTDEFFKLPGETREPRPRIVPVIAPPFSTRNRHSNDQIAYPDVPTRNAKVVDERNPPISPSPYLLKKSPRPKAKETFTCARVRPFHTEFFDGKEKKKRKQNLQPNKPGERFFTGEQQGSSMKPSDGSVSSIRPSSSAVQTLVHHIRNGGPKKVASGLHAPPASPAILPPRVNSGPGRASISANSNLQPPKLPRMATGTPKSRRSPNFSMLMDPSTISLGPSAARDAAQHPSTSYSMHSQPVQRAESQTKNTVDVRRRPTTNQTFVRHVPLATGEEARPYSYKNYNSTPRIVPGYRNRTSIIVGAPGSVTPSYRPVSRDQYSERSSSERQSLGDPYYRRLERPYPPTQNARSRLTLVEPSHPVYPRSSYSPYQGNSVTSRMREVSRPVEVHRFQRYESYVDPFASDSRASRSAVDPEAAAAVASIVNENSDQEDAEVSELIEKAELPAKIPREGLGEQAAKSSFRSQKVLSEQPTLPATHLEQERNIDKNKERKQEAGETVESAKVEDRQEDGLAVLALAAESHAAVRDRKVGSTNDKPSQFPKILTGPGNAESHKKITSPSVSNLSTAEDSQISTPKYQILGLEEEDDDDY